MSHLRQGLPAAANTPAPAPAAPAAAPGPATQALVDKKAARKAIMDEMNAKLKALDDAPAAPEPAKAPGRRRKAKGDVA
ncbi:MAG: hypothetical protein J0L76_03740 [Rhodobacterales bacterium]|nr:hypothetical protein [Rhodobacterales bacterium]